MHVNYESHEKLGIAHFHGNHITIEMQKKDSVNFAVIIIIEVLT